MYIGTISPVAVGMRLKHMIGGNILMVRLLFLWSDRLGLLSVLSMPCPYRIPVTTTLDQLYMIEFCDIP